MRVRRFPWPARRPRIARHAAIALAASLCACGARAPTAASTAAADAPAAVAGWYAEGRLQPCGRDALAVTDAALLDQALRDGGMAEGGPVYVRVEATQAAGAISVTRILQVGSPAPVRDCPMTGPQTP